METSGRNCRSLRRSLSLVISFLLFLSGPSPVMRLSKMTPPQHIAAPQLRPAASFPIKASDQLESINGTPLVPVIGGGPTFSERDISSRKCW